ncbi:PBE1 [Symbiodinium sp. CCMP2592]|nr:PBE1 [Symbiodinium sp. CCMP2592]
MEIPGELVSRPSISQGGAPEEGSGARAEERQPAEAAHFVGQGLIEVVRDGPLTIALSLILRHEFFSVGVWCREELQKKAREVERKNDSQQRQEDVPDAGAVAPDHDKEELQKKIRELERQNESQQRQIEALEAEKAVEQRATVVASHGQELAAPAPAPVQEFVAPAPIPPPRPEAGYAAEFFNTTNSTEGSHVLGWIGDGGGWEPGGEPPRNAPLPPIPPGDTEPPGPCGPMCRCGQVVSKASEVEKPWIADEVRRQAILAAIERFQSHPGVERRGKVSRQNRFEPAAPEKMNRALTSEPSRTQYTREVRVLR